MKKEDILFECNHIDDSANYKLIEKGIKITPSTAITCDYEMRIIANRRSPYGFKCEHKEGDNWVYLGLGNSAAASIITALLKKLKENDEYYNLLQKDISEFCKKHLVEKFNYKLKLKKIKKLAKDRNYLDYGECLDDILNII